MKNDIPIAGAAHAIIIQVLYWRMANTYDRTAADDDEDDVIVIRHTMMHDSSNYDVNS